MEAYNVYRKFVKGFSRVVEPLSNMMKKGTDPDWQNPAEEQLSAFNSLKEALVTTPVLELPKKDLPYVVDIDT